MAPERQPWFRFYAADWRGDANLRACGLAARGLWADCMTLMHEATPRGYLVLAGRPMTVDQLALLVSRPLKEVRMALAELEQAGVPSRSEAGVIYSRRMVRDTFKSADASGRGSLGGNPQLKPINGEELKPEVNGLDKPHMSTGISLVGSGSQGESERDVTGDRFETFWAAYPRKDGRKAALKAFAKLAPDHELFAVLLDAIVRQKLSRQWREGYVPHASTWLNGERWTDATEPLSPRAEPASALRQDVQRPSSAWQALCAERGHEPPCALPSECERKSAEVPA